MIQSIAGQDRIMIQRKSQTVKPTNLELGAACAANDTEF
jgi:hypothetical protein